MPKKRKRGAVLIVTDGSTEAKVQLSVKDTALAHKQAEERGIPWQDYVKSILLEQIRKTEAGC